MEGTRGRRRRWRWRRGGDVWAEEAGGGREVHMVTMTTDAEKYRRKTKSRRNKQPRQTRAAILSRYFPRTEDGHGADRTATLKQLAMQGMRGKPYGARLGWRGGRRWTYPLNARQTRQHCRDFVCIIQHVFHAIGE